MAIFTKQFANADEYEEWLREASGQINVLTIENPPLPFDSTTQPKAGPIFVRYQTHDRSFAHPKSTARTNVEIAMVAAAFFAGFLYLIFEA